LPVRVRAFILRPHEAAPITLSSLFAQDVTREHLLDALGVPYAELLGRRRTGMPTVSLQCEFMHLLVGVWQVNKNLSSHRKGASILISVLL
jgi:hypothetical protein